MAIGQVSNDELEKELASLNIGSGKVKSSNAVIEDLLRGRGVGKKETPESARKVIAELVNEGATSKVVAEVFGISPSSISAYKQGATSTASYNDPNPDLKNHVDETRKKIIGKANNRIVRALHQMTPDKFEGAKLKELASVAKDMSSVIRNLEPEKSNGDGGKAQFVFFSPVNFIGKKEYPIIQLED